MNTNHKMFSPWSEVTSEERNEVVFEHLHKNYGAYEIRTNYDRALIRSFSTIGSLILLLSAGLTFLRTAPELKINIPVDDPKLLNIQKVDDRIYIPKPPDLPRMNQAPKTSQTLVPEVTTDPEKDPENILPVTTPNNTNTTGTPCDSCPDTPTLIPGNSTTSAPPLPEILGIDEVEVLPQFPGGDPALHRFLSNNTHIPEMIREMGNVKEKVGVVFVVDKDGSVIDVELKHSSRYKELNNEALRVIKKMPKWEPGLQHGNPVKVRLILPMRFEVK